MDGESVKQVTEAADHAAKHGTWFSEAFFAVGAALAGAVAGLRLRSRAPREYDDDHPLITTLREESAATRRTLHDEGAKTRDALHVLAVDIAVLKDRRP